MPEWINLNVVWFFLVGALFTGYAMLDGFDLGIGALHLLGKTDQERRLFLNSIGPVWDGNEVWLVTGGGALFAAFPEVYATAFSGFYMPFMLLLVSLIFRAVSIEFRSKQPMRWWRTMWDVGFSVGSLFSSLLIGIAMGNIAWGVPLDERHEFTGTLLGLLHPYALLVGVTTVALFLMHGSIYLVMKTEGETHDRVRTWVTGSIIFFILCYATTTMATLLYIPRMTQSFREYPILFALPLANLLLIANIPREIQRGNDFIAFLSSCGAMICLMGIFGAGMFPEMLHALPDGGHSLTIYNGASSRKTLGIMLLVVIIGAPLVLSYTAGIYWIFRGKTKLEQDSY